MVQFINDFISFLENLATTNPSLGIFIASLIGNLIPFFPVPYLFLVVIVAQAPGGPGLIQLATVGALGASVGKFAIYSISYGAGATLAGSRARFDSLRKLLGGSAFLAAFIFAASPFPDDVVFIPLGIMRYSPAKTFMSLFAGKFFLTLLVAYLARSSSGFLNYLLGGSPYAAAASAGVVIVIAIVMMKVDWEKILERQQNGFIRRVLRRIKLLIRKPKQPSEKEKPPETTETSSPSPT